MNSCFDISFINALNILVHCALFCSVHCGHDIFENNDSDYDIINNDV